MTNDAKIPRRKNNGKEMVYPSREMRMWEKERPGDGENLPRKRHPTTTLYRDCKVKEIWEKKGGQKRGEPGRRLRAGAGDSQGHED